MLTSMDDATRAVAGRHLPALDGVRACAILGVIAYHLGFGWASGGYLGVDLFFVLSGFLITSLLVEEWCGTGRVHLGAFWGRRARRLLPALFLVLVAVAIYAVANGRLSSPAGGGAAIDLSGLRGDALATLFYVANWHAIFVHQSYFAQFSTPSPLQHTWSLAIEEQFYLVWPLVIVGLFRWWPGRWRRVGLGLCAVGALASAGAMAALYHAGGDPSRVYYGTDTRAFDLLVGAALALTAAGRPQPGPRVRSVLHVAAPVAAVLLGVLWATTGTAGELPASGMYRGGFLGAAVLAAVVVADVRQLDQGVLGRVLSVRPLRWIGTISYGLYLWHWPVFVYLDTARTGWSGLPLDAARVAVTFLVAAASFYALERPVRRRRLTGTAYRLAAPGAALVTVAVVLVGTTPSVAAPPAVAAWSGGGLDPGAGAGVAGVGGLAGELPIRVPDGVVVSRAHRLRVLTFGDSVMSFAERGLATALGDTGEVAVGKAARAGWGLERPGDAALLARHIHNFQPQVLLGTWSWDAGAAAGDPAAYRTLLDAAIRRWLGEGRVFGVVFLQMPLFGPGAAAYGAGFAAAVTDIPAWNAAVRQAAAAFPGKVAYLPVGAAVELDGRYTTWLPATGRASAPPAAWVRVRTADDVHLCPPGITRYAAAALADLTPMLHLSPPSPGWWSSKAITLGGLGPPNSLALSCPVDHPPPTGSS